MEDSGKKKDKDKRMFKLGEYQTLKYVKKVDFGIYLEEEISENHERVLLPKKSVPSELKEGDMVEVFLYKDSSDRLIATTAKPFVTLGNIAYLTVSQVNKMGAFLQWGLEKDLFLPFKQQTVKVKPGDNVLIALYVDKSERLCATMNVYKYLTARSPYEAGDEVAGIIYETSDNYGYFVAVDNKYQGIIPKKEAYGDLFVGKEIKARVTTVRDDGKLNLRVREKFDVLSAVDMEKIMNLLDDYNGVLPFSEKASPEVIKRETGMSKNEFKKTIGHLYKQRLIDIRDNKIYKV